MRRARLPIKILCNYAVLFTRETGAISDHPRKNRAREQTRQKEKLRTACLHNLESMMISRRDHAERSKPITKPYETQHKHNYQETTALRL